MINKTDALWAANLHVKTSTADKAGTILDTATTLAICRVLVETEARLQRALDHDHGKALAIARARANAPLAIANRVLQAPLEQGGEVTYVPSNLQAIQLCACGHQLPHLEACLMTTDPEAIQGTGTEPAYGIDQEEEP